MLVHPAHPSDLVQLEAQGLHRVPTDDDVPLGPVRCAIRHILHINTGKRCSTGPARAVLLLLYHCLDTDVVLPTCPGTQKEDIGVRGHLHSRVSWGCRWVHPMAETSV